MTDSSNPQTVRRLAAFRYRDFRLFWLSLFVSNIGSWMQMTATNWLLYELTSSPLQLGLNGVFRAIPALTLGWISGTFADRYDRKRFMMLTQATLALITFMLGILDYAGKIQAWQIYLFTFVSASVGAFDGPVRQALFPSLIPRAVLPNAVALNSLLWKGAALLGPTLGGIAISLMGTAGAFFANAASFLVVVFALLLMRAASAVHERRRDFIAETREGFSYILSQPIILGITVMEAFASIFGIDHALLTILASDIFRVGASGFGFLQSARGLGAVIGSTFFITMGQRPGQGRILCVSALLYGAGFALFGLAPSFSLALVLLAFVGATDTIWSAARGTILQMLTPERFRGRVMGVFQLSNRGLHPLGQLESGILVPLIGAREATVIGGAIVSLMTLVTVWRVPAISRFRWNEEDIRHGEARDSADDAAEKLKEAPAQMRESP
jgi:MFS family permease